MSNEVKQIRKIVPIEQWLNDPYYIGSEYKAIYPYWQEVISRYVNGKYSKFIFHGSYRYGKTYTARILFLRLRYEMSCYENFPVLFNLSPTTTLKFIWLSISEKKAKSTGIDQLLEIYDSIPYFTEHAKRNKNNNTELVTKGMNLFWGADVSHMTGEDLYGVIFDEGNFVRAAKGQEFEKARKLFLEAQIRGKTTFSIGGKGYGFYGLMSSSDEQTSFVEREVEQAEAPDQTFKTLVARSAIYLVKPQAFSPIRKAVFPGNGDFEPFIVEEATDEYKSKVNETKGITFEQFIKENEQKLEYVPIDLLEFYRKDIDYALKTISGIPRRGTGKLFKNLKILESCFRNNTLKNPIDRPAIELTLGKDDTFEDYIDEETLLENYEDGQPVYIHFDLSRKNDSTGFGSVYKSAITGKFRGLLQIRIKHDPNFEEIDIQKVIDIVHYMSDIGITIGHISGDIQFMNLASQSLKKKYEYSAKDDGGRPRKVVEYLSVDKDASCYLLVSYLIKKGIFETYWYEELYDELRQLDYNPQEGPGGKVTHVDGVSEKDIADGMVGAAFSCVSGEGLSTEDLIVADVLQKSKEMKESGDGDFYDGLQIEDDKEYTDMIGQGSKTNSELEDILGDDFEDYGIADEDREMDRMMKSLMR